MKDIQGKPDIQLFVNAFYDKVRADALLGGIFASSIAPDAWPTHLEKMYNFWNGILFQANDYHGHPFRPHRAMPVQTRHFDRWVALFTATIDEHFQGDKADEVKARATQIAHIFDSKIKMLRDEQTSFFDPFKA